MMMLLPDSAMIRKSKNTWIKSVLGLAIIQLTS